VTPEEGAGAGWRETEKKTQHKRNHLKREIIPWQAKRHPGLYLVEFHCRKFIMR
jgi:hypothetical protein